MSRRRSIFCDFSVNEFKQYPFSGGFFLEGYRKLFRIDSKIIQSKNEESVLYLFEAYVKTN
jgi:hypothetical protein